MPKYAPNLSEEMYSPLELIKNPEPGERRDKLEALHKKIGEIISFIDNNNLLNKLDEREKLLNSLRIAEKSTSSSEGKGEKRNGENGYSLKKLLLIVDKNLKQLPSLIDNPEISILPDNDVSDALGNLETGIIGLSERIALGKSRGDAYLVVKNNLPRYADFINRCVAESEFLKTALTTRSNKKI